MRLVRRDKLLAAPLRRALRARLGDRPEEHDGAGLFGGVRAC